MTFVGWQRPRTPNRSMRRIRHISAVSVVTRSRQLRAHGPWPAEWRWCYWVRTERGNLCRRDGRDGWGSGAGPSVSVGCTPARVVCSMLYHHVGPRKEHLAERRASSLLPITHRDWSASKYSSNPSPRVARAQVGCRQPLHAGKERDWSASKYSSNPSPRVARAQVGCRQPLHAGKERPVLWWCLLPLP
jgi:hypothetical protein